MEHWAWARWFKVWQVCMDRDGEGWMTGELEPREVDSRDWCQRSNGRLYKEGERKGGKEETEDREREKERKRGT